MVLLGKLWTKIHESLFATATTALHVTGENVVGSAPRHRRVPTSATATVGWVAGDPAIDSTAFMNRVDVGPALALLRGTSSSTRRCFFNFNNVRIGPFGQPHALHLLANLVHVRASLFCAATETATLKAYWAHVWQRSIHTKCRRGPRTSQIFPGGDASIWR